MDSCGRSKRRAQTTTTTRDKLPARREQLIPLMYSPSIVDLEIHVVIWGTKETVKNVKITSTIADLKKLIEITIGVPSQIQRLMLFDAQDLDDDTKLESLDVVNYMQFTLDVWRRWLPLMRHISNNDLSAIQNHLTPDAASCTNISVTVPSGRTVDSVPRRSRSPPPSEDVLRARRARQTVCLFMLAARSTGTLLERFLSEVPDLDVNGTLDSGCTALHTAVARGKYHNIDALLKAGANMDAKSSLGRFCLDIAKQTGHAQSEKHLFLFEWKTRARQQLVRQKKGKEVSPLMQHQQFDSATPTWMNGRECQKYLCTTLPASEFSGSRIDSKRAVKSANAKLLSSDVNMKLSIDEKIDPSSNPEIESTSNAFGACSLGSRSCPVTRRNRPGKTAIRSDDDDILNFHRKFVHERADLRRSQQQKSRFKIPPSLLYLSGRRSDATMTRSGQRLSATSVDARRSTEYVQPPEYQEYVLHQYYGQ